MCTWLPPCCHMWALCAERQTATGAWGISSSCSVALAWKLAKQEEQVLPPSDWPRAQADSRCEQRQRARGGWRASTHPVNKGGIGQRKSATSGMTGSHTFWGDTCLGSKEKAGKSGNLWCLIATFAHYVLITIKLALQIRSSHHALRL